MVFLKIRIKYDIWSQGERPRNFFLMIETVSSRHTCCKNEGILLYLKTWKKLVTFGKNTKIDAR